MFQVSAAARSAGAIGFRGMGSGLGDWGLGLGFGQGLHQLMSSTSGVRLIAAKAPGLRHMEIFELDSAVSINI